jgi:hypothetical protein
MRKDNVARQTDIFFKIMAFVLPLVMIPVGLVGDLYPFSRFDMFSYARVPFIGYIAVDNDTNKVIHLRSYSGPHGYWALARYMTRNKRAERIKHVFCNDMQNIFFPNVRSLSVLEFMLYPSDLLKENGSVEPSSRFSCPK